MEIISKDIQWCEKCNNYRGTVEEKYNGVVQVHCVCTAKEGRIKYSQVPCMNCPNGDKFCWLLGSNYKISNGETVHHCVVYAPRLDFN